jgi:hypothetical protein
MVDVSGHAHHHRVGGGDELDWPAIATLFNKRGTVAARPLASALNAGMRYYATDEQTDYRSTGTAWEVIATAVPDASLTEPKYVTDSVSQRALADLSVGTPELIDLNVTPAKLADALRPSAGASAASETLRALGTTPGTAAAGDRDFSRTFQIPHTFSIPGEISVQAGEDGVVPPFAVPKTVLQIVRLARVRFRLNNGAVGVTVSFKIQLNGAAAAGFGTTAAPLVTVTDQSWAEANPADITLAGNDSIQLVVTAIAGVPKNLSVTVILEHVA